MRISTVLRKLLGVERTVVLGWELRPGRDGRDDLVIGVRPDGRGRPRCSVCARRCPGYDQGEGPRRWRAPDAFYTKVFLEYAVPRVRCAEHGVVVAAVPWAAAGSRFTHAFEQEVAWLAGRADMSMVATLMRVAWRSVDAIVDRVVARASGRVDRLDGLRRIGIDETSYRKGQRYLLRVVDHDSGRQVWAGKGANQDTLRSFFDALGPQRCARLTHVSCDGAEWMHDVVTERAPQAEICLDPFHVVAWATKALDNLRRRLAGQLRGQGRPEQAATLKNSRWALLKNPRELTNVQKGTLAGIRADNEPLYRGYLLKEQLRFVFRSDHASEAKSLLGGWLAWANRCRIPEFTQLAKTIKKFQKLIWNSIDSGLSNARLEASNNHLRLIQRRGYGYRSAESLIAISDLVLGGLCPPLPGRA